MKYKIATWDNCDIGTHYSPANKSIYFSSVMMDYDVLTDDELIINISDTIVHEFMHALLDEKFNVTVSRLFDIIGHLFYVDYDLLLKAIDPDKEGQAWTTTILLKGIQGFLDQCHITPEIFRQAKTVCSNRQE